MDGRAREVADEITRADQAAAAAREQLAAAEDRAIAAEDEVRAARRDLRDARARIESLHRESRTSRSAAAHARVPSATPDRDDAEFRAARLGPAWDEGGDADDTTASLAPADHVDDDPAAADPTASLPARPAADGPAPPEVDDGDAVSSLADSVPADATPLTGRADDDTTASLADPRHDDDPTAPLPDDDRAAPAGAVSLDSVVEGPAGDDPTTARLAPVERGAPGLWSDADTDDSVRILRPRTSAGRLRPARVDPPAAGDDEEVPDPAAVGARLLRPAETGPRHRAANALANPRVIVGAIFALLFIAIVLIFSGFGLV